MNDLISIIIVVSNSKKWLEKCLGSLDRQTRRNFEIIVVDNGSIDGSAGFIGQNYPQVKIISSGKNLGYAGGNNLGIKNARGKYILILNPDTWVEDDFLEKLDEYQKEQKFDLLGFLEGDYHTKKIKADGFYTRIDPFGFTVSRPRKNDEEQFNVCGFAMFFQKKLYEETGGMDDNFFLYIEEIDWCWRLRMLGKSVGLADYLPVYHAGSADGKDLKYSTFLFRNRNIPQMLLKNYSWYNLIWVLPLYFLQNILEIIFFLVIGRPELSLTYVDGWIFIAKNFSRVMEKRKWAQKNRKVGDWRMMRKYFYFGNAKLVQLINYYRNKDY